jgi:voltage-gated potassium channel
VLGAALSSLRVFRLARLLRFTALVTVFIVALAGAAESLVEKSDMNSTWTAIWWAAATVTTVGYGDLHPDTVGGRLIAMFVMLVGIGFLAV